MIDTVTRRTATALYVMAAVAAALLMLSAPQPAAAQQSSDATLSGLTLADAAGVSPVELLGQFISGHENYMAMVLTSVTGVRVTPTASNSGATITVGLEGGATPETVSSGSASGSIAVTPKSDRNQPNDILVTVTAADGQTTKTYTVSIYHVDPLSFGSATIPNQVFTVGEPVPPPGTAPQRLPEASGDGYPIVYEASGLPDGLRLDPDRSLRGTPTAATSSPVTVTYSASDPSGSSASLTFTIEVKDAVAFGTNHLASVGYTLGQTPAALAVQLPEATGGAGPLIYRVLLNRGGNTPTPLQVRGGGGVALTNFAGGIRFNTATRMITGTPKYIGRDAFTYYAIDANGSYAGISFDIVVAAVPKLPAIADKTFTAGTAIADDANAVLPKARGGSQALRTLDYRLSPLPHGIEFDSRMRKLSGTPTSETAASTEVTYTVTDENEVSRSMTFSINVTGGRVGGL